MRELHRVTEIKCPVCFAKPGQMCTNKPAFRGGGVHTVPAHAERRDAFKAAKAAQDGQTTLEIGPLDVLQLAQEVGDDER